MRSPKLHRGHGLNKLRRRCDIILGILFSVNIVLFFLKRPNKASIANPRQSSTRRSASQLRRGIANPRQSSTRRSASQLRRGIIKKQSSSKRSAREEKRNDFSPPHPTFPRVFGARVWNKNVRCAFVTLLKKGKDITSYAGFLESSTRLRRTFQLKSEYPHYVVYEGQFPDVHQKGMILSAPWLKFYNVSHVWGNDYDRPPPEFWNATDRSEGYKHMCRFFGRQLFQIAALEIGLDIVMRVDDDILFLRQVNYDPFQIIWQSGAVYGFGSLNKENHFHTELTFTPWIREYCQQLKQIDYIGDDDDDFDAPNESLSEAERRRRQAKRLKQRRKIKDSSSD
uniref:Nucleotide-diphospho-sugar transferase domain-containing protein n=1 Tax=Aureoumbra lagunensis TaxID=44058 RepID=A0A7S3NJT3_9STRA